MANTQEDIDYVCRQRGLPRINRGTRCEVDGRRGIVVGGNPSGNLNVLFEDTSHVLNCHPYYKMRIFNDSGGLIYGSEDLCSETCFE